MIKQYKNMTEKERTYRREYGKKYYREHEDYFREYRKEYNPKYYQEHKEELKEYAKQYHKNHREDVVYFHLDSNGICNYIGSVTRNLKERQSAHMTGNSNLEMDMLEYIEKYDFSDIYYKDFTKYNLNKTDVRFIEKYFKKRFKEKIPSPVYFNKEKLSRSEDELIEIAENEDFQKFDLSKYIQKYLY